MSQKPTDLVRAAEKAFNERAFEGLVAMAHPQVEWETGLLGTPTYHGRQGVRQMLRDVETAWNDWKVRVSPEATAGDSIVVEWRVSGRGKTTGVRVDGRQFVAVELRDGLAIRVRAFQTKAEALEAAGLSE